MSTNNTPLQRPLRFESHALVDIKTSAWNPFAVVSAVMLDLSVKGFKIEFVSPLKLLPGDFFTMGIPLAPFHILSPKRLKLKIQIKWFDARTLRCGGVFVEPSSHEIFFLEQIVSKIVPEEGSRPAEDPGSSAPLYPEHEAS